jgi:hypothetical protein
MRRLNPEAIPEQDRLFRKAVALALRQRRSLFPTGLGPPQPRPQGRL